MPPALLTTVPPVTDPLPAAGAKVTVYPATKFPFASVTFTEGGVGTRPPAVPVCSLPPSISSFAAGPAPAAAANTNDAPGTAAEVAVSELGPAAVPRVQLPTAAIPCAFVVADPPVIVPPPDVIANVTATPAIGLSPASVMSTAGSTGTAAPAATD